MAVPSDDRGLTLGDGLFETLLAIDGRLAAPQPHLDRLAAGCAALGLPQPDRAEAHALMARVLDEAGLEGRAAVRLTLTAGSGGRGLDRPARPSVRLLATAAAAPAPDGPARLGLSSIRRNPSSPASRWKTLAYLDNVLARREARDAGADEALMLNTAGELACAAAANLFWLREQRLFTPALDCGVLAGTMRASVIGAAVRLGVEVVEEHAGPDALARSDAAFLTNSLIGLWGVASLDGRPMGGSGLIERLARLVSAQQSAQVTSSDLRGRR